MEEKKLVEDKAGEGGRGEGGDCLGSDPVHQVVLGLQEAETMAVTRR